MLRLAKWLMRLYPRSWRERYGVEFEAVLEQHRITIWTLIDLVFGALHARLTWERPGLWRFRFAAGMAALTFLALSTYTVIQQEMRHAANYPQVNIAQVTAEGLASGMPLTAVTGTPRVDVKTSLDPFVIVYNNAGQPVFSSGQLNGAVPPLPRGVLEYARVHGRDAVTWQPQPGVRIAAIVVHYDGHGGGFVLAGRSLRVTEEDEDALLKGVGAAYLACSLLFTAGLFAWWRKTKREKVTENAG